MARLAGDHPDGAKGLARDLERTSHMSGDDIRATIQDAMDDPEIPEEARDALKGIFGRPEED
jgi:hypothetical protein